MTPTTIHPVSIPTDTFHTHYHLPASLLDVNGIQKSKVDEDLYFLRGEVFQEKRYVGSFTIQDGKFSLMKQDVNDIITWGAIDFHECILTLSWVEDPHSTTLRNVTCQKIENLPGIKVLPDVRPLPPFSHRNPPEVKTSSVEEVPLTYEAPPVRKQPIEKTVSASSGEVSPSRENMNHPTPPDSRIYNTYRWTAKLKNKWDKEILPGISIKGFNITWDYETVYDDLNRPMGQRLVQRMHLEGFVYNTKQNQQGMMRVHNAINVEKCFLTIRWYGPHLNLLESLEYELRLEKASIPSSYKDKKDLTFHATYLIEHLKEGKPNDIADEEEQPTVDDLLGNTEHIREERVECKPGGKLVRTYQLQYQPTTINKLKPSLDEIADNPALAPDEQYVAYGFISWDGHRVGAFSVRYFDENYRTNVVPKVSSRGYPITGALDGDGKLSLSWSDDPGEERSALTDVTYARHESSC